MTIVGTESPESLLVMKKTVQRRLVTTTSILNARQCSFVCCLVGVVMARPTVQIKVILAY